MFRLECDAMDDAAPAGRRKFQFRLSTLIFTCLVAGLAVGLFLSKEESRRLREENARLKSKGGEQVFFALGGAQLTYHLRGVEVETFLAMLNSGVVSANGNLGGKPMGFFYVGNKVYSWYGGAISGTDKDGNPMVWTDACLSRMVKYCADRKYNLSNDEQGDLFKAFVGKASSPSVDRKSQ